MKTETGDIQQACHNVLYLSKWIPRWLSGNLSAKMQEMQVQSLGWEDPRRRKWQPTPVSTLGKSHGQRSLVRYRMWGHKESDLTEHARTQYLNKNKLSRDFPGGPVIKNPPANAGDMGSIPGLGTKIPHAVGKLSP